MTDEITFDQAREYAMAFAGSLREDEYDPNWLDFFLPDDEDRKVNGLVKTFVVQGLSPEEAAFCVKKGTSVYNKTIDAQEAVGWPENIENFVCMMDENDERMHFEVKEIYFLMRVFEVMRNVLEHREQSLSTDESSTGNIIQT